MASTSSLVLTKQQLEITAGIEHIQLPPVDQAQLQRTLLLVHLRTTVVLKDEELARAYWVFYEFPTFCKREEQAALEIKSIYLVEDGQTTRTQDKCRQMIRLVRAGFACWLINMSSFEVVIANWLCSPVHSSLYAHQQIMKQTTKMYRIRLNTVLRIMSHSDYWP